MSEPASTRHVSHEHELRLLADPIRWLRNRSLPLLAVTVLLLVIYPFFDVPGKPAPSGITMMFALVPAFGMLTLGRIRSGSIAFAILLVGVLLRGEVEGQSEIQLLVGWTGLLVLVLYMLNIWILAQIIFRSSALVDDRVYGGVAVYLLLGIVFAVLHHRIGAASPDAYRNVAQTQATALNWADFLYYSFSSMTTAGFGDIVPVSAVARSATSLEAVVGVLYPAVLIARLVNREFVPART
jgi:hypothetical protein